MNKICYFFLVLIMGSGLLFSNQNVLAQSPGGVTGNNTVWLRANSGVTLNTANNITTWAEQSGAGITGDFSTHNPGTGGTTQTPPAFLSNGLNFNPYAVFVSSTPNCTSSNNLFNGSAILGSQQMTQFQVINVHTATGYGVWFKWQITNTNPQRLGNQIDNPSAATAGKIRLDFRNSGSPLFSTAVVANKHTLYAATATANNLSMRINGNTDNSMTVSSTFAPSGTARLSLGNENELGVDPYPTTIDVAEVILYSRALTAVERNKVESYLAVKYGMTLPQTGTDATDYASSGSSTIWNNMANGTFVRNITGVGRDDASGLNQKQSLSINNRAMVTMWHGTYPTGVFPVVNADNTNDFAADMSYVLFGDNQADTLVNQCSANGRFSKMARTWKVQVTGVPGVVTLSLKKANVPPAITSLIVASDPGFTTGVTFIPIQDNGTELYASYNFTNNQYYTFGSTPVDLHGVMTPVLCQGNNGGVTLSPTGGVNPIGYSWNTTPPQTSQNLSGVGPGNYTVTVTQGNGCTFSESFTVTGNATPVFVKVKDTANTICTTKNGMIEVYGIGGTPSYTYNIDGGPFASIKKFSGLASGNHTVIVRDQNSCESDTTVRLTNYSYDIDVTADAKNAWCDAGGLGGEVLVNAVGGTQPYGYFWQDLPAGKGPETRNLPKGSYKVTVTDRYGCSGEVTAVVEENSCCTLWVPNAFSPNADGHNDKFVPMTNRPIPKYEMSIFNRWGQRIFYTTKYSEGWDGTRYNDGNPLDVGNYYYRIKYTCEMGNKETIYQGDLTLIR